MNSFTKPIDPSKLPNTEEIIEQVAKIRLRLKDDDMKKLEIEDKIKHRLTIEKEFFSFFEKYPSLFRQIYQGGDLEMLAQMLCAIDKIKNNSISVEKAEKKLGEQLADKYLSDFKK